MQRIYFCAVITPRILDSMVLINCGFEGCLDLIRMAVVSRIVAMGLRPAAFMVSPDSKTCVNLYTKGLGGITDQQGRQFRQRHQEHKQPRHFHQHT